MGIKPTSNGTPNKSTVTDGARTIIKQKSNGTDKCDLGQAAHLQSNRHHEEKQGCHFQLRQNRGVSDKYCRDSPAGAEKNAIARHEKEMTELATKGTAQIQEQKLALPDVVVEQWRGEKLPGVGVIYAAVAQPEVFKNKWLVPGSEDELDDEDGSVQSD